MCQRRPTQACFRRSGQAHPIFPSHNLWPPFAPTRSLRCKVKGSSQMLLFTLPRMKHLERAPHVFGHKRTIAGQTFKALVPQEILDRARVRPCPKKFRRTRPSERMRRNAPALFASDSSFQAEPRLFAQPYDLIGDASCIKGFSSIRDKENPRIILATKERGPRRFNVTLEPVYRAVWVADSRMENPLHLSRPHISNQVVSFERFFSRVTPGVGRMDLRVAV